jgi:hypothetical protein
MSILALALACTVVLPAVGLVAWVGLVMTKADDDLRAFVELAPAFQDTAHAQYSIASSGRARVSHGAEFHLHRDKQGLS